MVYVLVFYVEDSPVCLLECIIIQTLHLLAWLFDEGYGEFPELTKPFKTQIVILFQSCSCMPYLVNKL